VETVFRKDHALTKKLKAEISASYGRVIEEHIAASLDRDRSILKDIAAGTKFEGLSDILFDQ
jgi:hypothetical protein